MIKYALAFWQLDKAVDKLASWDATGVCYYDNGSHAYTVTRRNRAWYTSRSDLLTPEQVKALRAKAACEITYSTKETDGVMSLLLIPNKPENAQRLVNQVEKDMLHDKRVHNKRQRSEN